MSKAINATTTSAVPSPTRRAVLSVGAAALAASALPQAASAAAGNPWAPTELGLELMRRLPAYAAATYDDCNVCTAEWAPEYDAGKVATIDRAVKKSSALVDEAANAILDRPVTEIAHLTDLAIVQLAYWDRNDQGDNPGGDAASTLVVETLSRGGVSLDACCPTLLYKKVKCEREAAT